MIKKFYKDDSAYDAWLKKTGGWVYNDFGSTDVNNKKLHKSDCRMLHNVRFNQKKTSVRKICGTDLNELKQYITQERGAQGIGYSLCDFCMLSQNDAPNNFHTREAQKIEEKDTISSKNEVLAVAQILMRIYNEKKLPNYYNVFYKPLGLTKKEVEMDPNKIYWMIVLAAYDMRPFTLIAKGWEAIWGTKQESSSIYAKLNEADLLNMEVASALPIEEIRNRLKKEKFNGYRIDSNGRYIDYARTIKDAAHVVKDCQLPDLMIKAKVPEEVKTIFNLIDSVHGIGPTIASKLVMYTLREIGVGQISPNNLYPAVLPILKEFHNIKLAKELEQGYGAGFVDAIFESLKELGDPFAIDALYYIDREEPLLKRQLFEANKSTDFS